MIKRCKRCLIPGNFPDAKINQEGVCNFCSEGKLSFSPENYNLETMLLQKTELKEKFKKFVEKLLSLE